MRALRKGLSQIRQRLVRYLRDAPLCEVHGRADLPERQADATLHFPAPFLADEYPKLQLQRYREAQLSARYKVV
jgi:hypothetical protein